MQYVVHMCKIIEFYIRTQRLQAKM